MVSEKAGFYATGVADEWLFLLTQDCRFYKKLKKKKIEKMFISFAMKASTFFSLFEILDWPSFPDERIEPWLSGLKTQML